MDSLQNYFVETFSTPLLSIRFQLSTEKNVQFIFIWSLECVVTTGQQEATKPKHIYFSLTALPAVVVVHSVPATIAATRDDYDTKIELLVEMMAIPK